MANNLLGEIPSPTVTHNLKDKISRANCTPRLKAATGNAVVTLTKGDNNDIPDNNKYDGEMVDASNAVKTAAIGGWAHIGRLILEALNKGIIEPIGKFHLQPKENNETKQIKAAFTSPHLNEAAQRIATVIANKPPTQMPVLCGFVQETADKLTSVMEHHIQSLDDQLKAVLGKKSPKKVKGDRTKKTPPGILKNKDTPAATKKKSIPKSVVSPNLGVNSNDSARAKEKKKKGGRKVSFDG